MSLINLIQKPKNTKVATATVATPATDNGGTELTVAKVESVAVANQADIEKIRMWLFSIGDPEQDHYIVLDKCRSDSEAMTCFVGQAQELAESKSDKRQQKVLSMLADNPDIQRAFATDDKTDPENVILTVAIRNLASFEMLIPKSKYDPFLFIELINKGSQEKI